MRTGPGWQDRYPGFLFGSCSVSDSPDNPELKGRATPDEAFPGLTNRYANDVCRHERTVTTREGLRLDEHGALSPVFGAQPRGE